MRRESQQGVKVARRLTPAQKKALLLLSGVPESSFGDGYCKPPGVREDTLYVLWSYGYVDLRQRPMVTVARITDRGRSVLP